MKLVLRQLGDVPGPLKSTSGSLVMQPPMAELLSSSRSALALLCALFGFSAIQLYRSAARKISMNNGDPVSSRTYPRPRTYVRDPGLVLDDAR